jgi:uncharacterized protein YkwD
MSITYILIALSTIFFTPTSLKPHLIIDSSYHSQDPQLTVKSNGSNIYISIIPSGTSHSSSLQETKTSQNQVLATAPPLPSPAVSPLPAELPETPLTLSRQTSQLSSSMNIQNYIMKQINDYRKSLNIPEVNTDPHTCAFAKIRAEEISRDFSHSGFNKRISENSLPYPNFTQITENIALNSNYQDVVPQWISSSGHAENMRRDTPFVCVEKYGNYFAYEGFKP